MSAHRSSRRFPAPALAAASTLACALLAAGCGGPARTADLATPTAEGPGAASPSPTVPPYTTALTLNDEQKKAAEAALVAVESFAKAANTAYQNRDLEGSNLESYASDSALRNIKSDLETLNQRKLKVDGAFQLEKISVSAVDEKQKVPQVELFGCVPYSKIKFRNRSGTVAEGMNTKDTEFSFKVASRSNQWKVASQRLTGKKC